MQAVYYNRVEQPPYSKKLYGAVLFLDVCGFTNITETAHNKGYYGIEIITGVLNRYFEELNILLQPLAGEILKFGGDSCLVFFNNLHSPAIINSLLQQINSMCSTLDSDFRREYGFGFSVHGGAVFGSVNLHIIGNPEYHLDYYLYSDTLSYLYRNIALDTSKELTLYRHDYQDFEDNKLTISQNVDDESKFISPDINNLLIDGSISAELRNAVVVFLHLEPSSGDEIEVDDYNTMFTKIQKWVYQFGGVINKTDYTEKGYIILVLLGVPVIRGDEIERAILCAQRFPGCMVENVACHIGITYSSIYCGPIGSTSRWEYGIIGNAVNIAARLMSFAGNGQIAITKEIIPFIQSRFEVQYAESFTVKGIKEPIPIFLLTREIPEHWVSNRELFAELPCILPSETLDHISAFCSECEARLIRISGSPGSGKTYLLWKLCELLNTSNILPEIMVGEKSRQKLRLEFFFGLIRRKLSVISIKHEFSSLTHIASANSISWNADLVYSYLFPELLEARKITKEEADVAISCLCDFCAWVLKDCIVLVIDNLHEYDQSSIKLVQKLIPILLAAGCKVAYSATSEYILAAVDGFGFDEIFLNELKLKQAQQVIEHHIPLVSMEAIRLLHKVCKGNIKFLVALLNQIKRYEDFGSDLLTDKTLQDWQKRGVMPGSMEGVLLSGYLALPLDLRNILKLISIHGSSFTLTELSDLSNNPDINILSTQVSKLLQMGILELINRGDNPEYSFENPLLKDSIYRSILLSDKREIHRRLAVYLEINTETNPELMPTVVYHYLQAGDNDKVLSCSRNLAKMYFNTGAWSSCYEYYQLIRQFSQDGREIADASLRMAECSIILGDNANANDLLEQCQHLEEVNMDYWIYLRALYLNNIADYAELMSFLQTNLPLVEDTKLFPHIKNVYFEACLFSNEMQSFFKEALEYYPSLNEHPVLQHKLAGIIGQAYINTGEYRIAVHYYRNKLQIAEKLNDNIALRIACNGIGTALSRSGNKEEALQYYQKALKYSEQEGDRNGYAKVILNLGVHYRNLMDYDSALECYTKSLLLSRHIGNMMQESITLFDMGELYYYMENHTLAKSYFNQSLELAIRISDYTGISFCRDALGDLLYKAGDYKQAEATYRENLELQKKIKDMEGIAHTWGNLGNIAKSKKDYAEARKLYYRQLRMVLRIQDIDDAGRARFNLAMIDREQGYYKRALHQLSKAKELFESCQAKNFCEMCATQEAEIKELIRS